MKQVTMGLENWRNKCMLICIK